MNNSVDKIKVNLEKKVDYHEAESYIWTAVLLSACYTGDQNESIETIGYTAEWYDAFLTRSDMAEISNSHLTNFFNWSNNSKS